MLTVVEGLPGAGKSTVISKLNSEPNVNVIREVIDPEPNDAGLEFFLENDRKKYGEIDPNSANFMDRNFASTLCYSYCSDRLFGTDNHSRVRDAVEEGLEDGTLWHPDMYVQLTCQVATSMRRQKQTNRGHWIDERFVRETEDFYGAYFEQQATPMIAIDTDRLGVNGVAQQIKELAGIDQEPDNRVGQVEVIPFRDDERGGLETLVLKRSEIKGSFWQPVTGGIEPGETLIDAAYREVREELTVTPGDCLALIDDGYRFNFTDVDYRTGEQKAFSEQVVAMIFRREAEVVIGREHVDLRWTNLPGALGLLKYDQNKDALRHYWPIVEGGR